MSLALCLLSVRRTLNSIFYVAITLSSFFLLQLLCSSIIVTNSAVVSDGSTFFVQGILKLIVEEIFTGETCRISFYGFRPYLKKFIPQNHHKSYDS